MFGCQEHTVGRSWSNRTSAQFQHTFPRYIQKDLALKTYKTYWWAHACGTSTLSLGGWKHDTVIAPHHVEDRVQDFLACFLDISYIFWRCRRCTVWRGVATIILGPKVCGVYVLPAVDGSARALSPDASEWLMEKSCARPDLMKAQFMTWLAVWWEAHEIAWIMLGSYVRTLLYKQESRGSLMLCWHTGAGHCPFQEDPNWE